MEDVGFDKKKLPVIACVSIWISGGGTTHLKLFAEETLQIGHYAAPCFFYFAPLRYPEENLP